MFESSSFVDNGSTETNCAAVPLNLPVKENDKVLQVHVKGFQKSMPLQRLTGLYDQILVVIVNE